MQLSTIPQAQPTPNRMSSREVAELTGKNHADVMRDIRLMEMQLTKADLLSCVESTDYVGGDGRRYPMYNLDRPTVECLVTGYDPVSRMKVIQRLHFLEGRQPEAISIPKTLSQALLLAAQQAEQVEQLQLQVAQQQPAVEFYEAVASSKDGIQVSEAAKVLGVPGIGQQKLFEFLRRERILMTARSHWNLPYQEYVNREYFKVIETTNLDKEGKPRINMKTLVMQKGLDYIRKRLSVSS